MRSDQSIERLKAEGGKYQVVAGGRRLPAIEMLVRAKRWSASIAVVVAKDTEQARQWAHVENTARAECTPQTKSAPMARRAKLESPRET